MVNAIVAMIHVVDVDRSAEFYRRLGFEIGNYVPREGSKHWAWLYAPGAPDWKRGPNLMVTRGEGIEPPESDRVLFYLYAVDLPALRQRLLADGVKVGDIEYPEYLPDGECCVRDPDGYTLMLAQSAADTP